MESWTASVLGVVFLLVSLTSARNRTTLDDMMNVCKDGMYHKYRASPEQGLYGLCGPWSDLSCCTANISKELNIREKWHNFGYDHCPGRRMSSACRSRFISELCFNQCSPNLGPWLQPIQRKHTNEKFSGAPLCAADCETWWGDCKEEYTCIANWAKDFKWTKDGNQCPPGTACRKFDEIFRNATSFCQVIWNYSWTVVPDDQPCLAIYFNGSNPNRQVADAFARRKLGITDSAHGMSVSGVAFSAALLLVWVSGF